MYNLLKSNPIFFRLYVLCNSNTNDSYFCGQLNQMTHWLDLSNLYDPDPEDAMHLRAEGGKIKVNPEST